MFDIPISKLEIWRGWLKDLGGTYEPYRDLDPRKIPTGRRDKDKQPREYPLDDEKYGQDPKTGTIWRRQRKFPEGD